MYNISVSVQHLSLTLSLSLSVSLSLSLIIFNAKVTQCGWQDVKIQELSGYLM